MLNIVGTPSSLRAGAAKRIDGWKIGAKQKPMPISSTHLATPTPSKVIAIPKASNRSAEPDLDEAALLPCFTTRAPAAAVIIAAVVEMLIVCAPSPPVPTVSTARSVMFMGAHCAIICATKESTSCADSPFFFKASRNAFIFSILALLFRISFIAHRACSWDRSTFA